MKNNEQLAMSSEQLAEKNKVMSRIIKTLLIVRCSLLTIGAEGAKMCITYTPKLHQSASKTDGSWVLADNCAVGATSPGCNAYMDAGGTYDGVGAPSNYKCSGIKIAGVSTCSGGNTTAPTAGNNNGKTCLCKMTYPYEGYWVYAHSDPWGDGCSSTTAGCGEVCACHMSRGPTEGGGSYRIFQMAVMSGSK